MSGCECSRVNHVSLTLRFLLGSDLSPMLNQQSKFVSVSHQTSQTIALI